MNDLVKEQQFTDNAWRVVRKKIGEYAPLSITFCGLDDCMNLLMAYYVVVVGYGTVYRYCVSQVRSDDINNLECDEERL